MLNNILTEYIKEKQEGAVLIWVAVALIALLGFAALAVDVGLLMAARNEAQNAADAAALAGAGELGRLYYDNGLSYDPSWDSQIINVSDSTGKQNNVFGKDSTIDTIQIGCWDGTAFEQKDSNDVCSNGQAPNAVHVKSSGNNSSFFGKILDIEQLNGVAIATASLSPKSYWEPGEIELPIGISQYWFNHQDGDICGGNLKFYPTSNDMDDVEGCAGWTTFSSEKKPNTKSLWEIMYDIMNQDDDSPVSPEIIAGSTIMGFWGGAGPQVIESDNLKDDQADFQDLFHQKASEDGDGNDNIWTTKVLVYEEFNCNPNDYLTIIGVTEVEIIEPAFDEDGKLKDITANVKCEAEDFRGEAGQWFGIYGTIPGLVE